MNPQQPPGDPYVPYRYGPSQPGPAPTQPPYQPMPGSVDPEFKRYSYTAPPERGEIDEYRDHAQQRAYEPAGRKVLRIGRHVTLALLLLQLIYFAGLWVYTHFS